MSLCQLHSDLKEVPEIGQVNDITRPGKVIINYDNYRVFFFNLKVYDLLRLATAWEET